MSKSREEIKISKCTYCKKKLVYFHLHKCKRSFAEFYGCSECDNWCIYCNDDWNNHDKKK